MYIEVLHDVDGNILNCYCTDALPTNSAHALFTVDGGTPQGLAHARINISTVDALEIEAACGMKAVIDSVTGLPSIINVDRTEHIMATFKIDTLTSIPTPPTVILPVGVAMRNIVRA